MSMLFGKRPAHTPPANPSLHPHVLTRGHADLFEVTLLVGACFLVNYVTADGKTNWAEGSILIAFYAMIVRIPPSFLFGVVNALLIVPSTTHIGTFGVVLHGPKRSADHEFVHEHRGRAR